MPRTADAPHRKPRPRYGPDRSARRCSSGARSSPIRRPNAAAKIRASLTWALPSCMLPDSSGSARMPNSMVLASRTGEPSVFGLERDVGNLDCQELRAVQRHPRRSEHGVDIHARKALDRGFGFVAQPLRADPGRGKQIGAPTNDDGDRGEQGRGRGNAAQHPPGDAAALPEMILAGRRRKRAELTYLATAKPDLFVFCYLLIQRSSVAVGRWRSGSDRSAFHYGRIRRPHYNPRPCLLCRVASNKGVYMAELDGRTKGAAASSCRATAAGC